MMALRTGQPLAAQALVEEAEAVELPRPPGLLDAMRPRWVIGSPDEAAPGSPSSPRRTAWTR